jgi:hypothetical protein
MQKKIILWLWGDRHKGREKTQKDGELWEHLWTAASPKKGISELLADKDKWTNPLFKPLFIGFSSIYSQAYSQHIYLHKTEL